MNLQSLVVVVLRLTALDFLLRVAVQLAPQLLQFLKFYENSPLGISPAQVAWPWVILVGLVGVAVLLWVLALPIARLVTRRLPQDISFGAMSLLDCYSIAFIGVGLFYIVGYLPQVLNWSHYFLKMAASHSGDSWKDQGNGYQVSQVFVPFIIGVLLFVNGRSWARILATRQEKAESQKQDAPPHCRPGRWYRHERQRGVIGRGRAFLRRL